MSLTPETDQDSCPGWLPPEPLDLVSPQEGFSPGPLTPRFKRFPATRILPITFCVFSVLGIEPLCENTANWESLLRPFIVHPIAPSLQKALAWYNGCWIIIT